MSRFLTAYSLADVAQTHIAFAQARRAVLSYNARARTGRLRSPGLGIEQQLERAYLQFRRDLDEAARKGAEAAQRSMREHFQRTALRPETDKHPHLIDLLTARPANPAGLGLPVGAVGVGNIDTLDRAIDPDYPDAGPYWRAQEYGTTKHVGRILFGYFVGGGLSPERPRAKYAGGGGPHPQFAPTGGGGNSTFLGPRGGRGGPGEIRTPLKPRHFIRDGARDGRVVWLAEIDRLERNALSNIARLRPRI